MVTKVALFKSDLRTRTTVVTVKVILYKNFTLIEERKIFDAIIYLILRQWEILLMVFSPEITLMVFKGREIKFFNFN